MWPIESIVTHSHTYTALLVYWVIWWILATGNVYMGGPKKGQYIQEAQRGHCHLLSYRHCSRWVLPLILACCQHPREAHREHCNTVLYRHCSPWVHPWILATGNVYRMPQKGQYIQEAQREHSHTISYKHFSPWVLHRILAAGIIYRFLKDSIVAHSCIDTALATHLLEIVVRSFLNRGAK